jgi:hypothetical protein
MGRLTGRSPQLVLHTLARKRGWIPYLDARTAGIHLGATVQGADGMIERPVACSLCAPMACSHSTSSHGRRVTVRAAGHSPRQLPFPCGSIPLRQRTRRCGSCTIRVQMPPLKMAFLATEGGAAPPLRISRRMFTVARPSCAGPIFARNTVPRPSRRTSLQFVVTPVSARRFCARDEAIERIHWLRGGRVACLR